MFPPRDEAGLSGFLHDAVVRAVGAKRHAEGHRSPNSNAAVVDALNDPGVRKQLENLGLQMPSELIGSRRKRLAVPGRKPRSQNGGR